MKILILPIFILNLYGRITLAQEKQAIMINDFEHKPQTESWWRDNKNVTFSYNSAVHIIRIIYHYFVSVQYWLVKSEPDVFSFENLQRDGRTRWDGVRNYQARNNLRAMKTGDVCLFYHSNLGLEVVGLARVLREHYPDPTAEKGDWSAVDLGPDRPLVRPVTLVDIKAHPALAQLGLVRNPRLSVMPVSPAEFAIILDMGETPLPEALF